MPSNIRVFVVESQPVFCAGIQATVETANDIQCLGTVASFNQLCSQSVTKPPDILLVAVASDDSSLETILNWEQQNKDSKVLPMLSHASEICLREATTLGMNGCILKTDAPQRFIQAIRAIAGGEEWYSRQLLQETVRTQILSTPELAARELTGQDIEILQLICVEKSNVDIAAALHVSERTVCRYLEDIYVKLGVSSRVGAAVQAIKIGLA